VEAEVPDQEPNPPSFTFQQSTFVPQEQVIARFNQRDAFEPSSDEEKLVALRMFRTVLDLAKGRMVDGSFEWTMIAEVLAGRGVADCVRFYYQNKHIIFMKLEKAAGHAVPLVLTGKPEWSPFLDAELQRQVRNIFDNDRFLQYIATLEANNTSLRLRNDVLEKDEENEKLKRQLKAFQRQKDEDMEAMKKQFKAVQLQKDEEIESLKEQLAEEQSLCGRP
jgi:hypothetical protein